MPVTWRLPGYVIEELLGVGGTGEVWRARVSASGDPVALKRIPVTESADVRAARSEAALLSTLEHPHLIRLHELVPTADAIVLVLDLASAGSLAGLLSQRGRLTPGEVADALAPIGAALAYAHQQGVVHGDVSPANVLFTDEGRPLLADLGVARIIGDSGPVRSTPAYLDPAVASGSLPGAASDVFMLAAVALHALTGSTLWPPGDPSAVVAAAADADLADLPQRLTGVPPEVAAVLTRALVVEPQRRCTAAEFALDLRHSTDPVPIELHAGRRPESAGRHAEGDDEFGLERAASVAEPGRPAFERPGTTSASASRAQLTHGVRAALRPSLPSQRRPWWRRAVAFRAEAVARRGVAVGCAAVLIAAAGLILGWRQLHRGVSQHATSPASVKITPSRSPHSTAVARPTDPQAAGALIALDELRERAYGRNDPALLAKIYVPGPLLAQDTALLARTVPPGCELHGVHTTYSAVRATTTAAARIVVTTTATLAPSTLVCARTRSAAGAPDGPARLRIELVRVADGYRIASQRRS